MRERIIRWLDPDRTEIVGLCMMLAGLVPLALLAAFR